MFSSFLYYVHVLQRLVYNTHAEMSIIMRTGSCIVRRGFIGDTL